MQSIFNKKVEQRKSFCVKIQLLKIQLNLVSAFLSWQVLNKKVAPSCVSSRDIIHVKCTIWEQVARPSRIGVRIDKVTSFLKWKLNQRRGREQPITILAIQKSPRRDAPKVNLSTQFNIMESFSKCEDILTNILISRGNFYSISFMFCRVAFIFKSKYIFHIILCLFLLLLLICLFVGMERFYSHLRKCMFLKKCWLLYQPSGEHCRERSFQRHLSYGSMVEGRKSCVKDLLQITPMCLPVYIGRVKEFRVASGESTTL